MLLSLFKEIFQDYFCFRETLKSTLPFDELIKRASQSTHTNYFHSESEKYYLRSLGADERKDVADIKFEVFFLYSNCHQLEIYLFNLFKSQKRISSTSRRSHLSTSFRRGEIFLKCFSHLVSSTSSMDSLRCIILILIFFY